MSLQVFQTQLDLRYTSKTMLVILCFGRCDRATRSRLKGLREAGAWGFTCRHKPASLGGVFEVRDAIVLFEMRGHNFGKQEENPTACWKPLDVPLFVLCEIMQGKSGQGSWWEGAMLAFARLCQQQRTSQISLSLSLSHRCSEHRPQLKH